MLSIKSRIAEFLRVVAGRFSNPKVIDVIIGVIIGGVFTLLGAVISGYYSTSIQTQEFEKDRLQRQEQQIRMKAAVAILILGELQTAKYKTNSFVLYPKRDWIDKDISELLVPETLLSDFSPEQLSVLTNTVLQSIATVKRDISAYNFAIRFAKAVHQNNPEDNTTQGYLAERVKSLRESVCRLELILYRLAGVERNITWPEMLRNQPCGQP